MPAQLRQPRVRRVCVLGVEHSDASQSIWLLNSGASCRTTYEIADFSEFRELTSDISVTVAKGQRLEARGEGSVRLKTTSGSIVKLTGVLFVPQLDSKLVLVPALTAHGALVQFQRDRAVLVAGATDVASIPRIGKLFVRRVHLEVNQHVAQAATRENREESMGRLWHARLGHVSPSRMKIIATVSDGVPLDAVHGEAGDRVCGGCAQGKMSRTGFAHRSVARWKPSLRSSWYTAM